MGFVASVCQPSTLRMLAAALDLLKALLTEAMSVAEAGRGEMRDQEAGDDQDHA